MALRSKSTTCTSTRATAGAGLTAATPAPWAGQCARTSQSSRRTPRQRSRRRHARESKRESERERESQSWTESQRERKSKEIERQRETEKRGRVCAAQCGLVLCMLRATPESYTCRADAPEFHGLYLGLRGRVSRSFSGRSQAWSLDPWSPLCVKGGSLS